MKQDFQNKILSVNESGLGCLLTLVIASFVLGSIGLQWVINGVLIFIGLLIISPIIAILGFRWWVKKNVIEDQCPVCNYSFTGLNNSECRCPNCGELLKVENRKFIREIPSGTIEVKAVEIADNLLDDVP